jgi:hypothetical protein
MRYYNIFTSADVEKFKQKARKLKRETGIPHYQALEQVAQDAGLPNWHHITKYAAITSLNETAFRHGIVICMDIKEGWDFRAQEAGFVEDWDVSYFAENDLRQNYLNSEDDDGILFSESNTPEELAEYFENNDGDSTWMMNDMFFRFVGTEIPSELEQVLAIVRKYSFWQPYYVWIQGTFHSL